MKAFIKLFTASVIVILIISGSDCDKTNAPTNNTNCPDNNTFECATLITLGIAKQDNISANDDVDIFQFTLPQDGVTEVAVTNVPSNINLNVFLYGNTQNQISQSVNTSLGENVYLIKGQKGGTGYVRIEDRDHNANSSSLYSIMLTQDVTDSYELNETFETAKLIQQNTPLQAKFRPNDDIDAYQFTIPQDGVIDISVWNVPNTVNAGAWLYNNNYGQIASTINAGLGQGISLSIVRKQGLHYLAINDRDHDASSTNYYNFSVYLDISDVFEYNNSKEDAKSISLNSSYQAKLRPKEDMDFLQFNITTTGNIIINVTSVPPNIDMDVKVFQTSEFFSIASSTNTGNGQPVILPVNNLQPGLYYVKFEDGDHDQESTQFFNFIINK